MGMKVNCNKLGLDIGSTTVKLAVFNQENELIYRKYKRHLSDIKNSVLSLLKECFNALEDIPCTINITGSGGISISQWTNICFVQEVIACTKAVETLIPQTDVVVELGGEDAKITYFRGGMEQRMNGNCAGGTGAFIDQMATLLNTDAFGLNEFAKNHTVIYPIASRCGVFAKTDVQALLNDGVRKEDIAASILQAVVNQTIAGLACGKPIRGKVAFLGGPLCFLSELRQRFIETLKLEEKDTLSLDNSELFVAMGAAFSSDSEEVSSLMNLVEKIEQLENDNSQMQEEKDAVQGLSPLFNSQEDYTLFLNRHKQFNRKRESLKKYSGHAFLGIDAGSTTTKIALIGENSELLYSFYGSNEGNPLLKVVDILKDLYDELPREVTLSKCVVTGYGEALLMAALHGDIGEIETMAHYKAADFFLPGVDFILDIGGQDMKCLRIKNGVIDNILLNEACSSGCGSFLEGFADSLNMTVAEFTKTALFAKKPVDLGSKCTVFMNSRVKQAQKEGAEIGDLSAGLAYSVIKNALYKVVKIRDEKDLGTKIIVQGGTFCNDAVLRAFELISGRQAVRPEIAGLMGAFGAALIAKERYREGEKTNLLPKEALIHFHLKSSFVRCQKCGNNCLLTINHFSNNESFIAGNRCERGAGIDKKRSQLPNLYQYKYNRTFEYYTQSQTQGPRGIIGIPRVLNMYENYPFWYTLLTELGFQVRLSNPSSKKLYESGIDTIPSESVCFPAKLSHGHIANLVESGIRTIFYPSVVYEMQEFRDADNYFNCPVVTSYPEVIRNNMEELKQNQVKLIAPFLSMNNDRLLAIRIWEEFKEYHISLAEVRRAIKAASIERAKYKQDIQQKGKEAMEYLKENHKKGVVLCGKPYHIDPEINHGISEMIHSLGLAVLTEDSISHLAPLKYKLRVVDQWVYNSRLYRAASFILGEPNLNLVQLNSFGCGLDAVTTDQVAEILAVGGKMYTMLKIDEGNNLGAVRIRIRSLIAAIEERERREYEPDTENNTLYNGIFTKKMRKTHTILAPQMSPVHFELIQVAARATGYHLEVLPAMDKEAVEEGLRYVNNDACYPAIIMIGQIIKALKSGNYNLNQTSVIISQTGGGCRATNYIGFLKLGLKQAGYEKVPIISLNVVGLEKQPGFKVSFNLVHKSIMALIYGDLFLRVLHHTRPYEKIQGSANGLYEKWNAIAKKNIEKGNRKEFRSIINGIIHEFDLLKIENSKKPIVAVVGEILVKYHPTANNDIIGILEKEGAEVVMPDLLDFFYYTNYNSKFKYKYLAGKRLEKEISGLVAVYLNGYRRVLQEALKKSKRFVAPATIEELAEMASPMLSLGNQTGEGWLVTAEMIEFMKNGTKNIICVQPLACLPNHIVGKGMFKTIKEKYPEANIIPIDYDPGISQVNQVNRIKMMISVAKKNI